MLPEISIFQQRRFSLFVRNCMVDAEVDEKQGG